jgi:hypothetical protein
MLLFHVGFKAAALLFPPYPVYALPKTAFVPLFSPP